MIPNSWNTYTCSLTVMKHSLPPAQIHQIKNQKLIWAIPAIHGEIDQLVNIHDAIIDQIKPGDRILYHGNTIGYGTSNVECIDEILTFRRMVLSKPGMMPHDFIYLRGQQEEMWEKLLQIQFAPNPEDVLLWVLGNGLRPTFDSYGICPHDGIEACKQGVMPLTKWTHSIRDAIRRHQGHETFFSNLTRAATTSQDNGCPLLFVHAGLCPHKDLSAQGDAFWWSNEEFDGLQKSYFPFQRVVRGFDPQKKGREVNCIKASIDEGCGFDGHLSCTVFEEDGNICDLIH